MTDISCSIAGNQGEDVGGKYHDTPVIELCQNVCHRRSGPSLRLHQVGTCGEIGLPVGLLVEGKCVTCNNNNGRCVHRSVFEKRSRDEGDSSGVYRRSIVMNKCLISIFFLNVV